ncbi:MAG: hypothetical protein HUK25_01090 [Treponema sp.]|nr:hypothetical protein [Treponema sp.]
MKAIIISDESETIDKINTCLIKNGFDTIIYRWLLKALDNIEEIRPDLVVVSTSEYPRHWKTLTQFITSGIGGDKTSVILYTQNSLSDEDKLKAETLGVKGYFENTFEDGLNNLELILNEVFNLTQDKENENTNKNKTESVIQEIKEDKIKTEEEITETSSPLELDFPVFESSLKPEKNESEIEEDFCIPTVSNILESDISNEVSENKNETSESYPEESESPQVIFDSDSATLLFIHPVSGKIITGAVLSYSNKRATFKPESFISLESFKEGMKISILTFELDSNVKNYKAVIEKINSNLIIYLEEEIND